MLWAIGVVAEVIVFIFMHRLQQRWGLRRIMLISLLLCVIRWLLIGFCLSSYR